MALSFAGSNPAPATRLGFSRHRAPTAASLGDFSGIDRVSPNRVFSPAYCHSAAHRLVRQKRNPRPRIASDQNPPRERGSAEAVADAVDGGVEFTGAIEGQRELD